jgi:YD repeat-containing protein
VASLTYPNGDQVSYGRDSVGRVSSVSYLPSGGVMIPLLDAVTYSPFGPVKLITFHGGRQLGKFYDQDYAIDKVISNAPTGLLIDAVPDVLGNLKSASSTVGASPPTRSFAYDALYRLTGVTNASGTSLESYAYNRTGDRTSKTLSGQAAQAYTYNTAASGHRLQSVAGVARSYDANGNTTGRGDNARYTYSDANRLAEVCQPLVSGERQHPLPLFLRRARAARAQAEGDRARGADHHCLHLRRGRAARLRGRLRRRDRLRVPRPGAGGRGHRRSALLHRDRPARHAAAGGDHQQRAALELGLLWHDVRGDAPQRESVGAGRIHLQPALPGAVLRCRDRDALQLLQRL